MTLVCPQCSTGSPEGFRFCPECGATLAPPAPPRQVRKIVTALFCDITGSTALGEELDPEVLRGVLNRYFREIRTIIERHGGTVEKFIGDAVMAVFGIPRVQEDDALRAVRAAAEIRSRLPKVATDVGVKLRFRTGVNTGSVLTGEGENLAVGDAVNVAARLEQAAEPGEIVLGEETLRLVRDAVEVEALDPLELKGKSEPVSAFRLISVDPAAAGFARHLDVPLVGRGDELRLLREAWDRVVRESGCHLLTLLGAAGVGKSRLVAELVTAIGSEATALRGRCLHYGEGITFWPVVEALMPVGEPARQVLDRLGSGGSAIAEELFWDVRRVLESLAAQAPVLLHVDDLQWAESMLLDLLDHVADISRGAPILLLCTARPELLEERPGWAGGKLNATTLLLESLAATDAEALLDELGDSLEPEARARVIAASEGNPLFLEEMVALAQERGTVEVPPTIQALLAARLERLGVEERELLERGAVEGEVFHRLAVKALAGERLAAEIELRLAGLVRKELIRPHPSILKGDDAFRFRHLLIRDAAYDTLPKATRADLHERFAYWLEEHAPDLLELDEIAGWHLEQAVRYRQELGQDVNRRMAARAAEHLYASGTRAWSHHDLVAARNLLGRAHSLLGPDDSARAGIAVSLAEVQVDAGDYAGIDELLAEGGTDPLAAPIAAVTRMTWLMNVDPEEYFRLIGEELAGVIEVLERRGDSRGLAKAHMLASSSHWMSCQAALTAQEARLAAEYARAAGDEGTRALALGWYAVAIRDSPTPTDELKREFDAIEREQSGPYLAAWVDHARTGLAMIEGRFDDAAELNQRAAEAFASLGHRIHMAAIMQDFGRRQLASGNLSGALQTLLEADASLAEAGERSFRSTAQALLGRTYAELGDRDRAQAAVVLAEELGGEGDLSNFIHTHAARMRLALDEGDLIEAERWARSALEVASRTDFVLEQGGAMLDLGGVLAAAGKRAEAIRTYRVALTGFEAKGDKPRAERARKLLAEL